MKIFEPSLEVTTVPETILWQSWLTAAHGRCVLTEPAGGDTTGAKWVIPGSLCQHAGYEWLL